MNMQGREVWESFLGELLKRKEETAGVSCIRADLCGQILDMSKKELFEFCQDLETIPGFLEKPEPAMDCETCRKEFGACTAQFGDVNYKICEERFWSCVEKRASHQGLK